MPKKIVWEGLKDLKAHLRPIESLKPMEGNPKRHSERQLTALVNALTELGQHRPAVIDKDGVVLIGNGMLEAARRLEWTHLAVVTSDGKDQLRALLDNSIADLGTWDQQDRAEILRDLAAAGEDLRLFGWSKAELDRELQNAMDGLTDDIQDLADAIEAEAPIDNQEDAQAIAQGISDKISKRLHTIAKERPEALTRALGLVMDRAGGKAIFCLLDPNTSDVIAELKRLAEDADSIPEGSPLAALMEGMNT